MNPIFVPITQNGLQIAEFDSNFVLSHVVGDPDQLNVVIFEMNGKEYPINCGSSRYHLFKKSLNCNCCGIKANRCYLNIDKQSSYESHFDRYHFNFYAEVGDQLTGKVHFILFTKDHIHPRSSGGVEDMDNLQTLCYNCNTLKGTEHFSVEQMRQMLFPAYRAYKSSCALNSAKEITKPLRQKIEKNKKGIIAITKALEIVKIDRADELNRKIIYLQEEIEDLNKECDQIELQAQLTGTV